MAVRAAEAQAAAGLLAAAAPAGVTIAQVLALAVDRLAAAGVESPRLDAELLLADALGISREALLARRPEPLPEAARAPFEARLGRRLAREPIAYILGRQEFYGLTFEVTPAVLIPRPESELLVEEALAHLGGRVCGRVPVRPASPLEAARLPARGERGPSGACAGAAPVVADVGTGSGCLAVAIAVHAVDARVVAVDRSAEALAVARRNAARHAVLGQVRFVRGHLLEAVAGPLDLVVANLPYVPTAEVGRLMPEVRSYEPPLALDGGEDGLALLRPLVASATGRLAPGGRLLLEVAAGQAGRVADLLYATGAFSDVATRRDLSGVERVVSGRRWALA